MKAGISIIICCYNSATRIARVLEHLADQKDTKDIPYEIIVVNNASKDNTVDVAKNSWKGNPEIFRIIEEKKPGLSYARMAGLSVAQYDLINFIDDDNFVEDRWLSKIFKVFASNPEVAMCGGYGIPEFDNCEKPEWFDEHAPAYAVGHQGTETGILNSRIYLHGAGITIRRKVWQELSDKAFTFQLSGRKGAALTSGEDYELSAAVRILGHKLWYQKDLEFKHLIGAGRLEPEYLVKLYKAFGAAGSITHIYRIMLSGNSLKDRINFAWLLTSILYGAYKFLLARLSTEKNKRSISKKTELSYWKGYVAFKLNNPISYIRTKKSIMKFAKNCGY